MNSIFILSVTHDDGENWFPVLNLGFFVDEDTANQEANRLNQGESGELTRWEVVKVFLGQKFTKKT